MSPSPSLHLVLDARCTSDAVFKTWILALQEISAKLESLVVVRDLGYTVIVDPSDHLDDRRMKAALCKAQRPPKENCPRTAWLEYPTLLDTSSIPPKKRRQIELLIAQKKRDIALIRGKNSSSSVVQDTLSALECEWPLASVGTDPQVLALQRGCGKVTDNSRARVELWCCGAAREILTEDTMQNMERPVDVLWADSDIEFLSKIREKHGDIGTFQVTVKGWDGCQKKCVPFTSVASGYSDHAVKLQYMDRVDPATVSAHECVGVPCVFYTDDKDTFKEWHGLVAYGSFCPFQLCPIAYDNFCFLFELREIVEPFAYKYQLVMRGVLSGNHLSLTADDGTSLVEGSHFPMSVYNQIPLYDGPPLTIENLHRIFDAEVPKHLFANVPVESKENGGKGNAEEGAPLGRTSKIPWAQYPMGHTHADPMEVADPMTRVAPKTDKKKNATAIAALQDLPPQLSQHKTSLLFAGTNPAPVKKASARRRLFDDCSSSSQLGSLLSGANPPAKKRSITHNRFDDSYASQSSLLVPSKTKTSSDVPWHLLDENRSESHSSSLFPGVNAPASKPSVAQKQLGDFSQPTSLLGKKARRVAQRHFFDDDSPAPQRRRKSEPALLHSARGGVGLEQLLPMLAPVVEDKVPTPAPALGASGLAHRVATLARERAQASAASQSSSAQARVPTEEAHANSKEDSSPLFSDRGTPVRRGKESAAFSEDGVSAETSVAPAVSSLNSHCAEASVAPAVSSNEGACTEAIVAPAVSSNEGSCAQASVAPAVSSNEAACTEASVAPTVSSNEGACTEGSVAPCAQPSVAPAVSSNEGGCAQPSVAPAVSSNEGACAQASVAPAFSSNEGTCAQVSVPPAVSSNEGAYAEASVARAVSPKNEGACAETSVARAHSFGTSITPAVPSGDCVSAETRMASALPSNDCATESACEEHGPFQSSG